MQTPYEKIVEIYKDHGLTPGMSYRSSLQSIRAENSAGPKVDNEDNGYPWTIMTEQRARVFDWNLMSVVNEVVLVSGIRVHSIGKVVLLDCHRRQSCSDSMGHVHSIEDHKAGIFKAKKGIVVFADSNLAVETRDKVDKGHLWDGSAGYLPTKWMYLQKKQKMKIGGMVYRGPMKITVQSELNEFSITPIGADNLSKVNRAVQGVIGAPYS